ncbi:receptor-like protein 12 [Durio zibethinus]|uniref:Receptor-like protein 12 n=1 Tax=Durio zibethinus TaxID=66656 RepID=A0A6P5WNR1_DURZI|nr:receptor-like protein 12 [Durio zibethinus]
MVIGMLYQILCLLLAFLQYLQVACSWSSSSSFLHSTHLCLPEQRAALLEFKNTISLDDYCGIFASYPRTNSWNESTDCCSWEGVTCNKVTGHVIGIDLSDSCLHGSLHANNSLFHLQNLQWLDLSFNDLSGSLLENSSLFHLQGLHELNLAHNDFNGSISSELFTQLVSLTHLNLSHSGFSDLIPYEISLLSNLVSLDLSINAYSNLRFDAQGFDMLARNLTKIRNLVLDYVDMSGVAVSSFLNLTSSVESLSLRDCQLHGEFPSENFQLPYLQHIDLGWNENLTGYLPKTNLSRALKLLDLYYCGFRGSIPASFGNLTQIISIDLSGNSFAGQIPDFFGNLNKLTFLTFYSCNFSGQLPITMFNLTQITELDLSNNRLEGPLPNHVSELQLLEVFRLSNNSVSGGVPSWLFTLPSLQNLDLSHNKLTGPVDQIQKPNSVKYVDLSSNNIHGPIPSSFFDLVNLSTLHISSNNLSGVIESNMLSKLQNLYDLDLSNNGLLSLSTSGNDVNYSFPQLSKVSFSSCSIRQFPNFFRTSKLEFLDLSNNKISGGISKWEAEGWEQLTMLNLSYNFLTTLEQFPGKRLEVLDLHSNLLQGPILSTCLNLQMPNPPLFLSIFLISENNLTGNIPSLICNWTSLVVLDLSKNSLSGTIPECLGNFSYSLKFMNLQMNNFSGKIPDSFMNNLLKNLFLNDNQMDGLLPRSLANCSYLEVLNLGNNKLTDTFPHWLASLPSLQVLILRFNRLHGSIPNSIASSNFSALRIIDLSGNEFTGPLPTKLVQNLRAMKDVPKQKPSEPFLYKSTDRRVGYAYDYYQISVNVTMKRLEIELVKTLAIFIAMDFSNNLFCGQIPEALGELISLQMLNFSHNNFTGSIPPSLGNLVALESLDLSSNKLGGGIPSQLTNLTFLAVLNLSENNLVGPIPHGNQFGTFDNDSYSGNLGLCGLPLSEKCGNEEKRKPPAPKFKEDEDSAIPFIWKLAMMGYGCGLMLGLSSGYIVFTTGRPWWFVRMVERDWQKNVTKWIRSNKGRRN